MKKSLGYNNFDLGLLVALGVAYSLGAEHVAEEIVNITDEKRLLKAAEDNHDPYLKDLRKTIEFLRDRRSLFN